MNAIPARDAQSYPCVPPKVAAAQDYLRFAEQLRNPLPGFDGMRGADPRDLNHREQAVYDAALEVLRTYFTGEQEFAPGSDPGPSHGGDGPTDRVPVNS